MCPDACRSTAEDNPNEPFAEPSLGDVRARPGPRAVRLRSSGSRCRGVRYCTPVLVAGLVLALTAVAPMASGSALSASNTTPGSVWVWENGNVFGNGSAGLVLAHGLTDVVALAVAGGSQGDTG